MKLCVLALLVFGVLQPVGSAPVQPAEKSSTPANAGEGGALARFSAREQGAMAKQARWTFRVKANGAADKSVDQPGQEQIWNGTAYAEFRSVLAEYDSASKGRPFSGRVTAWGFTEKDRWPDSRNRPAPLWENTDPKRPTYTPFMYVNTALLSAKEKKGAAAARVEKVFPGVAEGGAKVVQLVVREYPNASDTALIGRLPLSWGNGYANVLVKMPPGMNVTNGEAVDGEFLLVADDSYERPTGVPDSMSRYRFEFASAARLSAEELAQAVLDGKARVVEWKFKRETRAGEDKVVWEREEVKGR